MAHSAEYYPLALPCALHYKNNVLALLDGGASPKIARFMDGDREFTLTALHMAADTKDHMGIAKNIILRHKEYNNIILPRDIGAALHIAARTRNSKVLVTLLENACDINVLNMDAELAHVGVMTNMVKTLDHKELSEYFAILKRMQNDRLMFNLPYVLPDDPLTAVRDYLQKFYNAHTSGETLSDMRFLNKVVLFYLMHDYTRPELFNTDTFSGLVHDIADLLLLKPNDDILRKTCAEVLKLDKTRRSEFGLRLRSDPRHASLVKKLLFTFENPDKVTALALSRHKVSLHFSEMETCFPIWLYSKDLRVWYDMRQFRSTIQVVTDLTQRLWHQAFTQKRVDVIVELENG
jgi:hypothetical protein